MIPVGFLSALIVVAATFQPINADRIVAEGCGQRPLKPDRLSVSTYVVGGYEVYPKFSFPWMCSLEGIYEDQRQCGCSLIKNLKGEHFILTSARCVSRQDLEESYALVGAHNISDKTESSRQKLSLSNLFEHPDFNFHTYENDIAIFSLRTQIVENDYVQPICLTNTPYVEGFQSYITGWGRTSYGGSASEVLQEGQKPVIADEACAEAYGEHFYANSMLCAGYINGGVDSCQGDTGSPLVVYKDGEYQQVGVTSWGYGCATYPGVYADVYNLKDWINKTINA